MNLLSGARGRKPVRLQSRQTRLGQRVFFLKHPAGWVSGPYSPPWTQFECTDLVALKQPDEAKNQAVFLRPPRRSYALNLFSGRSRRHLPRFAKPRNVIQCDHAQLNIAEKRLKFALEEPLPVDRIHGEAVRLALLKEAIARNEEENGILAAVNLPVANAHIGSLVICKVERLPDCFLMQQALHPDRAETLHAPGSYLPIRAMAAKGHEPGVLKYLRGTS